MTKQGKTEWNSALNEIEMLSNIKIEIVNASLSGDIGSWIRLIEVYIMTFGSYMKLSKNNENCDPSKFNKELLDIKDSFRNCMPIGFTNIMQAPPAFQESYKDDLEEARTRLTALTSNINLATKEAGLGIPIEQIKELTEKLLGAYKDE